MPQFDLVLLHAPSVYDFREKTILYGPVSDLIPPSPVFEMYPIGLASIAEYLGRYGYRVKIVNLAVRMMKEKNFDAEAFIQRLSSPVFGIDLHWLVHAHGAIEVAKIVKKYHPKAKVLLGGFSASYFYPELLRYPEVDYVLRGDSTEEPLRELIDCIKNEREPEAVPNLVWRDKKGEVWENPLTHLPTDLSDVMVNHYDSIVRSVIAQRDLKSYIPFRDWLRYPITAIITCRGCTQNCVICGGSAAAFKRFLGRSEPVYRSPQAVADDAKKISRFSNGPIFILGDLRQPGDDYGDEVLDLLKRQRVKNQFIVELFYPATTNFIRKLSVACPNFCLEISPESSDPEVRMASGKNYTNEALEQTLGDALHFGCGRLDVFSMIGLPNQTPKSVMDGVDYCGYLMEKFKGDKRLSLFMAPLAPFLDPGSLAFEEPKRYGYRILFGRFEDYRQALISPSWKYALNYETSWLDRHQLAEVTYEAILKLNRYKAKYGLISQKMAELAEERTKQGWEMLHRIDEVISKGNDPQELSALKPEIDRINMLPASEKRELELPVGLLKLKPWRYLWSWATGR